MGAGYDHLLNDMVFVGLQSTSGWSSFYTSGLDVDRNYLVGTVTRQTEPFANTYRLDEIII